MRIKPILPLLVAIALLASVVLPRPARTQQRGLGATQAPAGHYYALVIGNDDYASLPKLKTAAAEAGKDYVSKYESCPTESDKNVVGYIRMWLAKYEAALREWQRWQSRQP